jgi:hypothetical protein
MCTLHLLPTRALGGLPPPPRRGFAPFTPFQVGEEEKDVYFLYFMFGSFYWVYSYLQLNYNCTNCSKAYYFRMEDYR